MGVPSISIMLHELIKLLHHAQCHDVILFRLGTSGGVGKNMIIVFGDRQTFRGNWFLQVVYASPLAILGNRLDYNIESPCKNTSLLLSLGLAPGTVVITDKAVDYSFRPQYEQAVLGKVITRSTELDEGVASELLQCSSELKDFPAVIGHTMCAHDFYEGTNSLLHTGC